MLEIIVVLGCCLGIVIIGYWAWVQHDAALRNLESEKDRIIRDLELRLRASQTRYLQQEFAKSVNIEDLLDEADKL